MSKAKHEQLYPALVRAVIQAVQEIFEKGQYADRVIERTLKADRRRGSRDRAFIAENVYEIVRHYRLLYTIDRGKPPHTEEDWWRLFGIRWLLAGYTLPPWREFKTLDAANVRERYIKQTQQRKIRESIPDWLDERGERELGDQWTATLGALNQPAPVVLRTNTLKTDAGTLQRQLREEGIETKQLQEQGLLVTLRKNLFATTAFRQGWFEVQGWSSQQVAPFMDVSPGMRLIDACAGAGGKTLQLAALLENKGQIVALDTETWKLDQLRKRARRAGVHIVEPRPIQSRKVIKRLHQSADRLLLDVPCSGLGILRRNPDAKWKLSPEFIERVHAIQIDILQHYPQMVRPGGKMVYATCSVLPSENQEQVAAFLASEAGKGWTLEAERTILPQEEGFDGFYMARLQKEETVSK